MVADRASVLIVDDEVVFREVLSTVLREEGYVVRTAADGQAALRLIDEERPDLIISDVMMPQVSGMELLRRLRDAGQQIPVILMSAGYRQQPVPEAHFVAKPFDFDELIPLVRQLLP